MARITLPLCCRINNRVAGLRGRAAGTLQRVLTNRRPEFKGAIDGNSARPLQARIQNRLDYAAIVLPDVETVVLVQGPD
jgi:hypothetical protein